MKKIEEVEKIEEIELEEEVEVEKDSIHLAKKPGEPQAKRSIGA